MKAKLEFILKKKFHPVYLKVTDDSHSHADHNAAAASGGTHFSIVIVCEEFKEMPPLKRHRAVYQVLENEFKNGLHALALKTYTAQEFAELESP